LTYIKEVILENFLSHEYSRVPLEKGINLITGPNGCGKSSILLAISIAMGQINVERGKKLSDLISYGKDVARVSIILDNSSEEGRKPFPNIRSDQVMISRIIRRDGIYWFELNQEIIEKSYIQKMLKKQGINPDNSLIIMHQNMIEEFILKNPIERLRIFEEALGLHDYRKHLENTVLKLQDVEKSKQSVFESLKQAEANLNHWKKVYERYLHKKKLIEELSKLKVELFWSKYEKIRNELYILKDKIYKKQIEKQSLLSEIEKLNYEEKVSKEQIIKLIQGKSSLEDLLNKIEEYSEIKVRIAIDKLKLEDALNLEEQLKSQSEELSKQLMDLELKRPNEKIENAREISEIEDEIKDKQIELKMLADVTESAAESYKDYLVQYEDIKKKYQEVLDNKEKLKNELKDRIDNWKKALTETVQKINEIFQNILTSVEGFGSIEIRNVEDFNIASLEIKIGFRNTSPVYVDSLLQSGGERTVATLAFLISMQQFMRSKIRAIDEFDVHLDPLSKERTSMLLSSLPKTNPDVQYIFITPDPLLKYFENSNVIIVTKQNGISNINKFV
jgi:Chromosome segregation ATPases